MVTGQRVRSLKDVEPRDDDEKAIYKGDEGVVTDLFYDGLWIVEFENGAVGALCDNEVEIIS